jgi:hypothetical protein
MSIPDGHKNFLIPGPPKGGLKVTVEKGPLLENSGWQSLAYPSETREIWKDDRGRFVFVVPQISPPRRQVVVDPNFKSGRVIGEFQPDNGIIQYPLENIGIIIFINWLAGMGDLILHAVGIDINGHGYCFAGVSHAGKSTLAAALKLVPGLTLLGDDNLALRYLDGQFWIYGTPWHQNASMCAPGGVPLEKIFFLDKAGDPGIYSLNPTEGISRILQTAFVPYYRSETLPGILRRMDQLTDHVSFYRLSYQLGANVWDLIRGV